MYIIVKDICGDYGSSAEKVIVLNRSSYAEVFRSKSCALRALKEIVEDINEDYEEIDSEEYNGKAYSFWYGAEIFYIYKLYIDNNL